jgi:hypothetical protein
LSYCIAHSPSVKGEKYWRNSKYWRLFQNHYITLSFSTLFHNDLIQTPIDFCEQATRIRRPRKVFYISLRPLNRLLQVSNWPVGIKSSYSEPIGSKEGRKVIRQRTPVNKISSICFHLNCWESGKQLIRSSLSKVKNPVEALFYTQNYPVLSKYFKSIS